MLAIGFDFSLLSKPYGLRRCTSQLMHLALAAERLGFDVRCITSEEHLASHPEMSLVKHLQTSARRPDLDLYVAKADAFYRDANWSLIEKLPAFKVCLCNSDRTFRETSMPFQEHHGTPVQTRCDLYMPCNYLPETARQCGPKLIPAAHPPSPQVLRALRRNGLLEAYLTDRLEEIQHTIGFRVIKQNSERCGALFVGNKAPRCRLAIAKTAPEWAKFVWSTALSGSDYLRQMMEYRAVLDLPGNGDKSIRLIEGVILGRTILSVPLASAYSPPLTNKNCILLSSWSDLPKLQPDEALWRRVSKVAMDDYRSGWSLRAQILRMVAAARGTSVQNY